MKKYVFLSLVLLILLLLFVFVNKYNYKIYTQGCIGDGLSLHQESGWCFGYIKQLENKKTDNRFRKDPEMECQIIEIGQECKGLKYIRTLIKS